MTVNKLDLPSKENAVQEKINEIIDNLGGGGGSSSLSGLTDVTLTSPTSGEVLDYDGSKWVNSSGYLKNTATGNHSLTLIGTASTKNYTVNIGYNSQVGTGSTVAIGYNANASSVASTAIGADATASNSSAVAVGKNTTASGSLSVALGQNATASGNYSIQLGRGTNSTDSSLSIGFFNGSDINAQNWQLLDGTTGLIPDARLSSNILKSTSLKTINSQSIVGSGNIAVQSPLTAGNNITFTYGSNNWTAATQKANLSSQDETLNITYGNEVLVSVDRCGNSCRSTDNGATWSTPVQFSSEEWFGSCYGDGKFVSISDTGYLYISTDDGATYSNGEYVGVLHTNIAYGNGLWIALTYHGYTAYANNLSNWSAQQYNSDLGNRDWSKPIWDGSKFVALSPQGYMATTTDGINYAVSTTDLDTNFTWYAFGHNGSEYIVIGTNGEVATSANCVNWTSPTFISNLGNYGWQDVAYNGTNLIAVGSYGYISTSETSQIISASGLADTDLSNLTDDGLIAIAHNAMPSTTTYDTLSVGSTGSYYDAPADGYYLMKGKTSSNTNAYINLGGVVSGLYGTNNSVGVLLPVIKGQRVYYYYNNVNTFTAEFIYAVGAESEKV